MTFKSLEDVEEFIKEHKNESKLHSAIHFIIKEIKSDNKNYIGKTITDDYCNGLFGRGSYDDKIIIASGNGWVVGKTINDYSRENSFEFATFAENEDMEELIGSWSVEEN